MRQAAQRDSRRSFLKQAGGVAAVSALSGTIVPAVHAGEEHRIKVALVGAGGRGTGAAANALLTQSGPIELVAMADVFEDKLDRSYKFLDEKYSSSMNVPDDRQFLGFDAYKDAMDCLDPGDVVILATPPAFRWVHFKYAIEKGLHTFMEKPVTVDGPTTRRMIELASLADEKGVKAAVGLMCRHCDARRDLYKRIQDGAIGDVVTLRSYRQSGGGYGLVEPIPDDYTELLWQVRRFHGFFWASGSMLMDYMIHNIDECCWMKDAWPVTAEGQGARCYRDKEIDQNFDNYSIEYTFDDGSKMFVATRHIPGCKQEFASYAHGSKGSAVISTNSHSPAKCRIYNSQGIDQGTPVWSFPQPEPSPYQLEWDEFIAAIRNDEPYNEVKRGAEASLVTAMGRAAVHTGRVVTFKQMLNHDHEFAPELESLTYDSPAPLQKLGNGSYPQPEPGLLKDREF